MKIVITGATGNIGTSTVRALASEPRVDEIVGIARRAPAMNVPGVRFVRADVTADDLTRWFEGASAVVHLAWLIQPNREPARLHRVNVEGSQRVFDAVVEANVPALVYASSVGAYSPGPKHRRVTEAWPTDGVPTSTYSTQKAEVERMLDALERDHGGLRVVRMRPGLVFKRGAASEIRRFFIGPFVPRFLFARHRIPFVPHIEDLRFQCVHSHDVGDAFAAAAMSDARGAFNVAADPVIDTKTLAEILEARLVRMPVGLVRHGVQAAWRLHLSPTDRSWVDLALRLPLMDVTRATTELDWQPRHRSTDALLELVAGLREGVGMPTGPLHA